MIKVYFRKAWDFSGVEVVFVRYEEGYRKIYVAKPVKLEWVEHEEGGDIEAPTLKFDRYASEDFMKAMAEALDQQGIKTENDHKIKGLLEAKEAHLQDMRTLVFKKGSANE